MSQISKLFRLFQCSIKIVLLLFVLAGFAFSQTTKWLYVQTIYGGASVYINEDIQKLKNGNFAVWDKRVKPNGSFAISKVEWDCSNKKSITRQMTMYYPNNTVIGTLQNRFEWQDIVPGSVSDNILK